MRYIRYEIDKPAPNYGPASDLIRTAIWYGCGGAYFDIDVLPGKDASSLHALFFDDGKMEVELKEVLNDKEVLIRVSLGGTLLPKKGVNLPDSELTMPSLTEKDIADLGKRLSMVNEELRALEERWLELTTLMEG